MMPNRFLNTDNTQNKFCSTKQQNVILCVCAQLKVYVEVNFYEYLQLRQIINRFLKVLFIGNKLKMTLKAIIITLSSF